MPATWALWRWALKTTAHLLSSVCLEIVKKEIGTVSEAKGNNTLNLNISIKNTTATIIVETNSKEALNINVLNENGKQIFYDTQKTGGKYNKEIPLGKKGTYFLNLIQNKKSTTEKIIIE